MQELIQNTIELKERNGTRLKNGTSVGSVVSDQLPASSTLQLTNSQHQTSDSKEHYDPFANRTDQSVSDVGALVHLLKGSLGTGILAMPSAFKNGGLAFGLVGTIVVGIICTHCVNILVSCSQLLCRRTHAPSLDYAETARVAFQSGPDKIQRYADVAKWFVNAALCATYYSAGAVYIVFISESVKQVGDYHSTSEATILDTRIYIIIFTIPLCFMCLIRNLKYLEPFSMLSNILIVVSFAITLSYIFTDMPSLSERKNIGIPSQIPLFFSTVIFAMEGIGVVMPIENSMKKPGHFLGCPGVLNISMAVVVFLYAVIGFFGYVKFGEDADGSVTLNLPKDEILAQVVKILIAIAIFFTFGLQLYVPNKIVWGGLKNYVSIKWQNTAQNVFRIIVVVIAACVGAAVPKLDSIISLVGAICFSTLGLLCPAIIDTVTCWDDYRGLAQWKLWKNVVIMALAIFALVSGTYSSVKNIISAYKS